MGTPSCKHCPSRNSQYNYYLAIVMEVCVHAIVLAALHPESIQNLVIWGSTAMSQRMILSFGRGREMAATGVNKLKQNSGA